MKTLSVDIRIDGIEIDGRLYGYPIPLTELDALFDEAPETYEGSAKIGVSAFWDWHESGMFATHTDGVHALAVKFRVDGAHDVRIEGRPFDAEFGPTGPTYSSRDFGNGYIMARRTEPGPDQHVREIKIEQAVRRQRTKEAAAVRPKAQPIPVADAVEFADLNFKLLVVQSLMYDKELLIPEFSLYNFLGDFSDREIDLRAEGHEPIPEALAYFAELAVPRALLAEIVELEQDGGNDIYMQIAPLWGGDEGFFDVADFADVDLLPNLRSMTLIGVDEATLESLRTKGIDAELL